MKRRAIRIRRTEIILVVMLASMVIFATACTATKTEKPSTSAPKSTSVAKNEVAGKAVTTSGKLSCTACNLMKPGNPCPPGCCERCVQSGDPVLLTDAQGGRYILLTGTKGVPLMNEERYKMLSGNVKVSGTLVKGSGVTAIYVNKMDKL